MSGSHLPQTQCSLGPQLCDQFAQLGPLECDNCKNDYIALSQPHEDRRVEISQEGTMWLKESCGIVKTY